MVRKLKEPHLLTFKDTVGKLEGNVCKAAACRLATGAHSPANYPTNVSLMYFLYSRNAL